jgi:hypothetical protein
MNSGGSRCITNIGVLVCLVHLDIYLSVTADLSFLLVTRMSCTVLGLSFAMQ